jgi:hypothetical protein
VSSLIAATGQGIVKPFDDKPPEINAVSDLMSGNELN